MSDDTYRQSQRGKDNLIVRGLRALGRQAGFKVNREEIYKDLKKAREQEKINAKIEEALKKEPPFLRDGHGIRGPQGRRKGFEIVGADGQDEQIQVRKKDDDGGKKDDRQATNVVIIGLNVNGAPGLYDSVGQNLRLL